MNDVSTPRLTAIALCSLFGLSACLGSDMPSIINVTEPGDTSLTCSELVAEINTIDEIAQTLQSNITNYDLNNQVHSLNQRRGTTPDGWLGALTATFDAFASVHSTADQNNLHAAQARRSHLTRLHNEYC